LADVLERYGWDAHWAQRFEEAIASGPGAEVVAPRPGRVVRHDGAGLMVATADGTVRAMFGPTVEPSPVVGDWIVLDASDAPRVTLERDSLLRRRAAGGEGEQPLVANLDLVLAVCGLDRPLRAGRIERTVTLATDAGAETVVVLTKADVVDPGRAAEAEQIVHDLDPTLAVVTLSAKGGWGVEDLLALVGTRTVALLGESGAGKSTLVNALVADEVAETGGVRLGDSKGRHTTTSRELHLLAGGGILVDTPGIREVGIFADPDAVAEAFADVDDLAGGCRFRDCAHDGEPGCAVQAAVEEGTLDADRLRRWRAVEAEAASSALRSDPVASRQRNRQFGRMAREAARLREERDRPRE
jgi:ribosome biogenesis GTPase